MKVAICAATYQRPQGLKRLLEGLNRLTFDKCQAPRLEVVVVDNDSEGLARRYLEEIRSGLKWPLRCSVEPRRGISYARNTAVALAREGDPDFVAFIDDDEVPEPSWLDELLRVQQLYDADVVTGPVLPHFVAPVDPRVKELFGAVPCRPTGSTLEMASTNNILVRSEVYKIMDKIFDERFALSAGEDVEFFYRVYTAGYKIVWANEASVHGWVPESRTNWRWIFQRCYDQGHTYVLRTTRFEPALRMRALLTVEASKIILRSLRRMSRIILRSLQRIRRFMVPKRRGLVKMRRSLRKSLTKREIPLLRALLRISYGVGILAGVVGIRHYEYRKIHGG